MGSGADRREDDWTRGRVEELLDNFAKGLRDLEEGRQVTRRSIIRMRRAIVILIVGFTLMVALGLDSNADRIDDNRALVARVQESRVESVLTSCQEQNDRNDATVRALDRVIARTPPGRQVEARASRTATILLIGALAPKRDCAKLAARLTTLEGR